MRMTWAVVLLVLPLSHAHADVDAGEVAEHASDAPKHWVSLGLVSTARPGGANVGPRLEVDGFVVGNWAIGAIVQKVQSTATLDRPSFLHSGQIDDWSAGLRVAYGGYTGGWELRANAALLGVKTDLQDSDFDSPMDGEVRFASTISPALEVGATLSRDLGARFSLAATVAKQWIHQKWAGEEMLTRDTSLSLLSLALRYRLR